MSPILVRSFQFNNVNLRSQRLRHAFSPQLHLLYRQAQMEIYFPTIVAGSLRQLITDMD